MSINIPHTAFGLVVVESIWPHQEFGYAKQNPSTVTKDGGASSIDKMENPNQATGTRMEYYNYSGEARGYYRIIPMNVISFSTTASVSGDSNFSVSFTMDDVILVGENKGDMDGLRAIIPDVLSIVNGEKGLSLGQFDKLQSLGLSAHRIGTPSSMFSIEDIVHTGDTVSLWFYNDPKDFQTSFQNKGDKVKDPIMSVILGSGDRTAQYVTTDDDLEDAFNAGSKLEILANKAVMNNATPRGNSAQLKSIADELSSEAVTYDWSNDIDTARSQGEITTGTQLVSDGKVAFGQLIARDEGNGLPLFSRFKNDQAYHRTAAYVSRNFYPGFLSFTSGKKTPGKGEENFSIKYAANTEAEQVTYFLMFNAILGDYIPADKYNDIATVQDALERAKAKTKVDPRFIGVTNGITAISTADAKKFIAGRNILNSVLQNKIKAAGEKVDKPIPASSSAKISRAHLNTTQHGETGYMIYKGHITAVNSRIQVGSSYEISISGSGLEYPLSKHIIMFDNNVHFQGDWNRLVDFPSRLSQLSPAKAMVFLVNRWMPKQIRWGLKSEDTAAKEETFGQHLENPYPLWLRRGNLVLTKAPNPDSAPKVQNSETPPHELNVPSDTYVFSPVHFINLLRIGEIIRATNAADATNAMKNMTMAYDIPGNASVWQACKKVAGASNIFELFVDEIGCVIYRPAGEAWERASQPAETPVIFGNAIQSITYSRSEDTVYTVVDVMPSMDTQGGSTYNTIAFGQFGRAVPKSRPVPINNGLGLNAKNEPKFVTKTAPELYRYGLRYMQLSDFYGAEANLSQAKADTIFSFYKDPLKRAEVSVLGNPSYRVGNTVIIHNGDIKRRSNVLLNTSAHASWLRGLSGLPLRRFLSADERLKDDQSLYSNSNFSMNDVWGGNPIVVNHEFVRNIMANTLEWMSKIRDNIPADLFPTTLWYYLEGKDSKSKHIVKAYEMAIKMALGMLDRADPTLVPYLRYVKLNNFICMSYYIEGVTHSFNQSSGDASTRLNLSYGQDNITVIHPVNMVPLGYLSVERKLKEGYSGPDNSPATGGLWGQFLQAYFNEQYDYKASSFLYKSQKMRNTINYQNELAYRLGRN